MKEQDYQINLLLDASAEEVFKNINRVTEWWTENLAGRCQKLHDTFLSALATFIIRSKC